MQHGDLPYPNRLYGNYPRARGNRQGSGRASYNSTLSHPRKFRFHTRGDFPSAYPRGFSGSFLSQTSWQISPRHSYRHPYDNFQFDTNTYHQDPRYSSAHRRPFSMDMSSGRFVYPNGLNTSTENGPVNPSRANRPGKWRTYNRRNTRRKPMNFSAKSPENNFSRPSSDTTADELRSDSNLRDKLVSQLRNSTYQCAICISEVRPNDPIWSCKVCFHIYHISCTKSWVEKSKPDRANTDPIHKWRCPSCQTEYDACDDVLTYRCFCGRQKNPDYHPSRNTIPHGCDEVCGKPKGRIRRYSNSELSISECTHLCTELCHPGPCPPCLANVILSCPCGKVQRQLICGDPYPSSCGQICQKSLEPCGYNKSNLTGCLVGFHSCLSPCHTGSCPPCIWIIYAACFCGNKNKKFTCGSPESKKIVLSPDNLQLLKNAAVEFTSSLNRISFQRSNSIPAIHRKLEDITNSRTCEKLANSYSDWCLNSNCDQFDVVQPRPVFLKPCFSCDKVCGRMLSCQLHSCPLACHQGECQPCLLDPARCLKCPCGRTPLNKLVLSGDIRGDRTSCSDPVPTCPNICGIPHPICGHPCPQVCHNGPCGPCESTITVNCRCGRTSKTLPCKEFTELVETSGEFQLICERICKKEKACGRHKCTNKCCNDTSHPCHEVCGRKLTCKNHTCEELCHANPCPPCWRGVIYTELSCRCGSTVLDPPQPCGSSPPKCYQPCNRTHNCDHPVQHTCHNEESCPPCTVRLMKECIGGHGVQFQLPCFQPALSCGRPCNRPLSICSHNCQRVCHSGSCLTSPDNKTTFICKQSCMKPRRECGHPCNLPCHEAKSLTCDQAAISLSKEKNKSSSLVPCSAPVTLICACSKRKQQLSCHQVTTKIQALQQANDPILSDLPSTEIIKSYKGPIPLLACDESCSQPSIQSASATWERGLTSIGASVNSDAGNPPSGVFEPPEYSDFLKQFALDNFNFAVSVERQLQNMVVELLKSSNSKVSSVDGKIDVPRTVVHHFAPMNKKRRQFIRELAEFYGIEPFSLDPEPNRHVMVLAKRGSTKLPGGALDMSASLMNTLKREFPKLVKSSVDIPKQPNLTSRSNLASYTTSNLSYAQILKERSTDS